MKSKFFKKLACAFSCAALLACSTFTTASAAQMNVQTADISTSLYASGSNVTHSGPLTIESHLQARGGYTQAFYKVLVFAPSDVVGIRINDMDILTTNSVQLNGSVTEVSEKPGIFESITIKFTLFYENKAPYVSYETINVNTRCGSQHPIGPECTL